ncbi:MAG: carboxypeptidase-like regulatory domain-containing protein, partial [Dehalococcoidales bacterium]
MMLKQTSFLLVMVLLALPGVCPDVRAQCNPIGAWSGTLDSDTQLGGLLTNWIFHADGTTGGEWTIDTVGGYTTSSDQASGMWICFSGRLLATYTGTAVESGYGSESGYTLELDGTTEGDTASGEYTIVFDNVDWEGDSGRWVMTGDAVSNHVFCIEISHGWDYEDPGVPEDLTYEVEVCIATDDTVDLVEFQTPTGVTLQIPKLPGQWDDVNKVWTEYYFDQEENCYWWEYGKDLPSPADMANYDGTYTIIVHYSDGSQHQTAVWFGVPNTTDPIPQPTQEPVFVVPQHHESIDSPVTFEWQQCTDPAVSDSNGIWIYLMREGTDEETERCFDKSQTSWGAVDLAQGFWEAEIDFERWYEYVNDDGIKVEAGKYSESDYRFAVDTPWTAYDVFGGNIDHAADENWWEYYYSIDRQSDYQKLDRTAGQFGQTATFFDDQQYSYYVIAARETLLVDSIRDQYSSHYWGPYPTGNTSDPGNITGPPDGQYATVGEHPSGGTYSGFVIISNQWNGSALTVITDIPGISVSGRVTDKATSLPLANMRVNSRHLDTETWTEVRTDGSGFYELAHLPPGKVEINVRPEQGSGYAGLKAELELTDDVDGLDFALPLAGRISGTVKDSNNNPVPNLWVYANEYESNLSYNGDHTDANGKYEITTLPPGTYRVEANTWDTDYTRQFYDHQTDWSRAAMVSVTTGEETTGIDFTLMVGASISGFVKNLTPDGIENVRIDCSVNGGYHAHGVTTDSNGFYKASGLLPGYFYRVVAYPPADTDYMITRIYVDVPDPNDYTAEDIIIQDGALTVAGRVTDKETGAPLAGIWVSCHLQGIDVWGGGCNTGPDGGYILTNLPPGWAQIRAEPEQVSGYAGIGAELELTGDLSGLDFALPPGATLSGRVIDIETAEPLENIEVTYWSDRYAVWQNDFTDSGGRFALTNLPPGIAEVVARAEVNTGYAWS